MKKNSLEDIKEKLSSNSRTDIETGCWLYQGVPHNKLGYCKIRYGEKKVYIHRLSAHIHWNFDLNSKLLILHRRECPNPNCWNPNHLYEGTHKDNAQDSIAVGTFRNIVAEEEKLQETCKFGHPLDGVRGNGKRYCKTCNRYRAGYIK